MKKTNYHTHTTYCDGKSTPEEVVLSAIEKGFDAIGFSGHGYTPFDLSYCMKDVTGYVEEINTLKKKYDGKIEIYCGMEEDAFAPVDREKVDYIIGSAHYIQKDGKYYPVDSGFEGLKECLRLFDNDAVKLADSYYSAFVDYILKRKPDIIGHFDLITKYDEQEESLFLSNPRYLALSEKYIRQAAKSGSAFEINTGAISRGIRKNPYPAENLLCVLKEEGCKIVLSSDAHHKDTIDCHFEEIRALLKKAGFDCVYYLSFAGLVKDAL